MDNELSMLLMTLQLAWYVYLLVVTSGICLVK